MPWIALPSCNWPRRSGWLGPALAAVLPLAAGAQQPAVLPPAPERAEISGAATRAIDTVTLVIGGRTVRLWGVDPGPASAVPAFDAWLRQNAGPLKCELVAATGRFKCMTGDSHDVAEVALFSGFARVGAGAMNDYRALEDQAREQHHGLWQQQ